MDHIPLNHRKRKASTDDSPDALTVDPPVVDCPLAAAPRQPHLPSTDWPSPSSQISSSLSQGHILPSSKTKRPRLHKIETSSRMKRPMAHKSPLKLSISRPPPTTRLGSDIEDLGIVSQTDPGPSSGSLLHLRTPQKVASPTSLSSTSPIDLNSTHVPPRSPLINRKTLKELDLDVILSNPQLRHDLLFDPGLQFRPTCSRKKRALSDQYWAAIVQEVVSGCTCVSFDLTGTPLPPICVCTQLPKPSSEPVYVYPSPDVCTARIPSRIPSLLSEFFEVLLLVIQPLSCVSCMYVDPSTFNFQMQEHSAQAAYLRSVFDPALIEQELNHDIFDPSGLLSAIGDILKRHCAPMRDRALDFMIQTAKSCAPGGTGTKRDAVAAIRLCMELLEFMKLDIANHQLQTLRPFLIRTSGQFELNAFKSRKGGHSLQVTREWLHVAHTNMLAKGSISLDQLPSGHLDYQSLPRNKQTYLATIKGIVDLIFDPPAGNSASIPPSSSPISPTSPTSATATPQLPGYPETSYLDNTRLAHLGADASDILATHMFLLLYRQLVFSGNSNSPSMSPDNKAVQHEDLLKLKQEIYDLATGRLGSFFSCGRSSDDPASQDKLSERRKNKEDIALQIAKRAEDVRRRRHTSHTTSCDSIPERTINLAQRWSDVNIQSGSSLATMLRHRLRDIIFNSVVNKIYPSRERPGVNPADHLWQAKSVFTSQPHVCTTSGMEPLTEDIHTLSEKISRLAVIHLNAFLPLYEQDGFLDMN